MATNLIGSIEDKEGLLTEEVEEQSKFFRTVEKAKQLTFAGVYSLFGWVRVLH